MTVFEKLKNELTVESMAELGVKLVSVDNRQLFYLTSSGQLFSYTNYSEALNHEYAWLSQEIPNSETSQDVSDTNEGPDNTKSE